MFCINWRKQQLISLSFTIRSYSLLSSMNTNRWTIRKESPWISEYINQVIHHNQLTCYLRAVLSTPKIFRCLSKQTTPEIRNFVTPFEKVTKAQLKNNQNHAPYPKRNHEFTFWSITTVIQVPNKNENTITLLIQASYLTKPLHKETIKRSPITAEIHQKT